MLKRGILAVVVLLVPIAFAQTTLYPLKDVFIYEGVPDVLKDTPSLYVGNDRQEMESITLAQFNTNAFASISSAVLTVRPVSSRSADSDVRIKIYALNSPITEDTSYYNQPSYGDSTLIYTLTRQQPLNVDVTSLLSSSQNLRYGIAVKAEGPGTDYNLKEIQLELTVRGTSSEVPAVQPAPAPAPAPEPSPVPLPPAPNECANAGGQGSNIRIEGCYVRTSCANLNRNSISSEDAWCTENGIGVAAVCCGACVAGFTGVNGRCTNESPPDLAVIGYDADTAATTMSPTIPITITVPTIHDAPISIATLKDSYDVGEQINLTDPPDNDLITGNVVNEMDSGEGLKQEIKEIVPETIDTPQLQEYVKGELIIKLKREVSNKISGKAIAIGISSIDELNRKYNVEKIENVFKLKKEGLVEGITKSAKQIIGIKVPSRELKKIYKLKIAEDADIERVVEEYSQISEVEYAEPNYISYISFVPNDLRYNEQWAHQNTQAELGWNIQRGNSNVVIAIVDTGVDYTHEDLSVNIWQNSDEIAGNGIDDDSNGYVDDIRGYDFVDVDRADYPSSVYQFIPEEDYNTRDNDPMEFNSHGTHVAGIAAAVTDNSLGVAGVCHNCKIMPVRAGFSIFHQSYGVSGSLENDDIAEAIHYAADNGAKVISMSFGGGYSDTVKNAIDYAYSEEVILIAAAGNDNTDSAAKSYPAALENVIAVAATDINENKASFSNYGYWTDVAAPGVNILSTVPPHTSYNSELKIGSAIIPSNVLEYSAATQTDGITANLIKVNFGKSEDLTDKVLTGKIALIQRGEISFKDKINNVKNAGAIGAIIYNNEEGDFKGTLNEQTSIPAVSISKADGEGLLNQINSGTVTVNLKVNSVLNKYASYQGTSMATPYVAGLAGLILSKQDYSQEWVKQILRQTVDPVNSDKYIGIGRVNVLKALEFEPVDAIAEISSPENNEFIQNNIDIKGTATGDSYTVYYGEGIYPKEWIEIGSGTNVNDGVLINWSLEEINEGAYTIKLSVSKNSRIVEDFVRITVGKGYQKGWPRKVVDNMDSQLVTADINNDGFKEFIVTNNQGFRSVPGFISALNYDGTIVEGWPYSIRGLIWATPSIGDVNNDGYLEIALRSAGMGGNAIRLIGYHGQDLDGWPKIPFEATGGGISSVLFIDINKDNDDEIIIPQVTERGGIVIVLDKDGNAIDGWPQEVDAHIGTSSLSGGDIDNDGEIEIVVVGKVIDEDNIYGKIYVFNHDGTLVQGWPLETGCTTSSPVLGDIDGDHKKEIILYSMSDDAVYIWKDDATLLDGWPYQMSGAQYTCGRNDDLASSPALGDIDKDGDLEIVVASSKLNGGGGVYAWHHNGDLVDGWPKLNVARTESSPIIGDMDGDGYPDVITTFYDGTIYAWGSDGKLKWSKKGLGPGLRSPIIDDIDKDGDVEIAVANIEGYMYVWDLDAPYNPSTMEWPMFQHDVRHTGNYEKPESEYQEGWPKKIDNVEFRNPPATADIDNDGFDEIIIASDSIDFDCQLYGWNHDGSSLEGNWPVNLSEKCIDMAPSIGDIDNDGYKDIVINSKTETGTIYVLDRYGNNLPNWPKDFGYKIQRNPVLGDINEDGNLEIIFNDDQGFIHAVKVDSMELPGWPVTGYFKNNGTDATASFVASPSVGDIDNDGDLDVVAINYMGVLFALDEQGNNIDGFPLVSKTPGGNSNILLTSLALADINNDGNLEIIVTPQRIFGEGWSTAKQGIEVYDNHGNLLSGYPMFPAPGIVNSFWQPPSIGDFNNDGNLEIVFVIREWAEELKSYIGMPSKGAISIVNNDGSIVKGWPKEIDLQIYNSPIISDIDEDNSPEIIVMNSINTWTGDKDEKIYAFNYDGSVVEGWPKLAATGRSTPAITDLDKDGDLELIYGTRSGKVVVLDISKKYNGEKNQWPMYQHDPQHTGNYHFGKELPKPKPQSKIANNEESELKGYLYIRIEKNIDNQWFFYRHVIADRPIYKQPRIIPAKGILKLDSLFNPKNVVINEPGQYRVVAEFKDESVKTIKTADGDLKAEWEFEVKGPETPTINCTENQSLGDVSGNGKIDPLDASLALQYIENKVDFENIRCADVNCDNQIAEEDAQMILNYIADLMDKFPCEE